MPPPAAPEPLLSTRLQRLLFWVALLAVVYYVLQMFSGVLMPFVAAAGMAYFLDPIATAWEKRRIPRTASAIVLVTGFFALCIIAVLLLIPLFRAQLVLLVSRVPEYVAALQEYVMGVMDAIEERLGPDVSIQRLRQMAANQANALVGWVAQAVGTLLTSGVAIVHVLMLVVVTPIVAFYLLRDWPKIMAKVESWVPRVYAPTVVQLANEIDRILSAWLRGQALCSLTLGLFYAIGLSAAGLELGLIVGLTAGILSFIPYVGTMTGAVASIGLAIAQFDAWQDVAIVAAVFMAGQILEGYVLAPKLVGSRVELHAVWVMFALLAGGTVFGFLGVLLAVPVSAAIGVLTRFWLRRYMASPFYLEPPHPEPAPAAETPSPPPATAPAAASPASAEAAEQRRGAAAS
ncbi:MAG: AI-2E family transporter [Alphaproteobacteria bacterium]|nr:AI-2E family transporter [Alphaproteobacteria bacterium]